MAAKVFDKDVVGNPNMVGFMLMKNFAFFDAINTPIRITGPMKAFVAKLKESNRGGARKLEKEIDEGETVSYNIIRNYNTSIGYNEAIEKYEDVIRKNPYDNNANHNLAYAYYSKALHLDDAIAMREDAQESDQGFLVKRYYLYNTMDGENPSKISLTKQTEPFGRESVALHNRSGDVYFKKKMFNDAIFEYRNALEINPKCVKALYNLAFSFFIKGTHIDVALRTKKIQQPPPFQLVTIKY